VDQLEIFDFKSSPLSDNGLYFIGAFFARSGAFF
jgi:hypothetical protein